MGREVRARDLGAYDVIYFLCALNDMVSEYAFTSFRKYKFLNLLWGPRFRGQIGGVIRLPQSRLRPPRTCLKAFISHVACLKRIERHIVKNM